MASIGDWVREVVTTGGYPGLAALIFIENIFPPIPWLPLCFHGV